MDKATGEIRPLRFEPDAGLHFEGTGETAWGTKFVMMAARSEHERGRVILDFDCVADPGGEARLPSLGLGCVERLASFVSGAQGVVYDAAFRGVHHQRLLRRGLRLPAWAAVTSSGNATTPSR